MRFIFALWFLSLAAFGSVVAPSQYTGIAGGGGNTLGLSCANGQVPQWNGAGFTACLSAAGTGTVTTINTDSTTAGIFANSSNVIGTGIVTLTYSAQTKNLFLAGPSSGSNAAPTYRLIAGADLPTPSASILGGVQSLSVVAHNFLTGISTAGVPTQAQPSFSDLSGVATAAQLPAPSAAGLGGVQSLAIVSHNFMTGISTSGVPTQAQPLFSDLGGVATGAQLPNPSSSTLGGIQSSTGVTNSYLSSISTSGVPVFTQPSASNLSDGVTGSGTVVLSTSPTITGASTSIKKGNCYLSNVESDLGNSGTALSIDASTANVFTATLTGNATITLTNYANNGCPSVFILTQDGTGSRTATFSGPTILWGNSGARTLSTPAGSVDKVVCVYNGSISKMMCDLAQAYQ